MFSKIMIYGSVNTGKTTLCSNLRNSFVLSRDGKPYNFAVPHRNVETFKSVVSLIEDMENGFFKYKEVYKKNPETIVIDSISRIAEELELIAVKQHVGYDVWNKVRNDLQTFSQWVDKLNKHSNVVLICHCTWNENLGRFEENTKGSFNKKAGGFLGRANYSLQIDWNSLSGKRTVYLKNKELSRTSLGDVKDEVDVSEFNLQDYLDKIQNIQQEANSLSL